MHFTTLKELLEACRESYGNHPAFGRRENGRWRWITYRQFADRAEGLATTLLGLGLQPGDRVLIAVDNGPEWAEIAFASVLAGGAFVPTYRTARAEEVEFIAEDSGARFAFAADAELAGRLKRSGLITLCLKNPAVYDLYVAFGRNRLEHDEPLSPPDQKPEDLACLIYTSGTTGRPKGVRLTHGNLAANAESVRKRFTELGPEDRSLAFLPWAHSFGLMADVLTFMSLGVRIAAFDAGNPAKLPEYAAEIRPTVICTVPDVIRRIRERAEGQVAKKHRLIDRLYRRGIKAAERLAYGQSVRPLELLLLWLARLMIFRKAKKALGGMVRFLIAGGSRCKRKELAFAEAMGCPICEGYGLTECSPIVSADGPSGRRAGKVGRPLEGVTVEIRPAGKGWPRGCGEITVSGPNVSAGYHNRPEDDANMFRGDGSLRTGDIGRLDSDGYLEIIGRIDSMEKINGKKAFPERVEDRLRQSEAVADAFVTSVGPYNIALILPADGAGQEAVSKAVKAAARDLGHEMIRRFALIDRPFADEGLVTPTMKKKRRAIAARYAGIIASLQK